MPRPGQPATCPSLAPPATAGSIHYPPQSQVTQPWEHQPEKPPPNPGRIIGVAIANPYQWLTKGELIKRAAEAVGTDRLEEIIPHTFSCATGNTQFFKGGSAFQNCGVCVACMTRRGAIRMSGLVDKTDYTIDNLSSDVRTRFLAERGKAVTVVTALRGWRPDAAKLISMGPFPEGFDYDRASALLDRGLGELTLGLP